MGGGSLPSAKVSRSSEEEAVGNTTPSAASTMPSTVKTAPRSGSMESGVTSKIPVRRSECPALEFWGNGSLLWVWTSEISLSAFSLGYDATCRELTSIRVPEDFSGELPEWCEWASCHNCASAVARKGEGVRDYTVCCLRHAFRHSDYENGKCPDWKPITKPKEELRTVTCKGCGARITYRDSGGHAPEYCATCLERPKEEKSCRNCARVKTCTDGEDGYPCLGVDPEHNEYRLWKPKKDQDAAT